MHRVAILCAISLGLCASIGCSAAPEPALTGENDSAASGSGGGAGGAASSSSVGLGGSLTGAGAPGVSCSADLQFVLDGAGNVVESCWPDKGCSNGTCILPCDAAASIHSNVGCSFFVSTPWVSAPDGMDGENPPCFAVAVANNWPKDAELDLTLNGTPYFATLFGRVADDSSPEASTWPAVPSSGLPPGKVAILFLYDDPAYAWEGLDCPVLPALSGPDAPQVAGSNVGSAWRITSSVPVSAYAMLPYGGGHFTGGGLAVNFSTGSAEIILPTTAWGTNYVAAQPMEGAGSWPANGGPAWGQLVAAEDDTKIQIVPTVDLPAAASVPAAPANETTTFTLNAGQYVQWVLPNQDQVLADMDLGMSGSIISADKPVAFTGGNSCACYSSTQQPPNGGVACDNAFQMIPPVQAAGFEYVASPHADRSFYDPFTDSPTNESIRYRLVGFVDGTELSYDPPVDAGPAAIQAGQVIDFQSVGAFYIKSQDANHPFYLSETMSAFADGPLTEIAPGSGIWSVWTLGGADFVNMVPPAQYLSKYVFFTEPTYLTTNLVITRVNTGKGFRDVSVDCLGTIGPWLPVGTTGRYEITHVDLMRLGEPNQGCTNGAHTAESEVPFGLMVWGLSSGAAYAYPAGWSVAPINKVEVPPVPK